jgi:uncharacterized cupredoxin-like copper-binding protein
MKAPGKHRRAVILALCALLLLAGCAGGSGGASTKTVRIIAGHLRFAPSALTVKAGTTVHFVLVNGDPIEHEFVLGPQEVQQMHEESRMSGQHMMSEAGMVSLAATKTVELTYTFATAGTVIFGCHVDDHYAQGMKGTVTVT